MLRPLSFVAVVFFLCFTACRDDEAFHNDPSSPLNIKADTLYFDTVFTQVGIGNPKSVNKQFVVINPYNKRIKTQIELAGGEQSNYRINVDGQAGVSFGDIEILPKDSVFVFVEMYAPKIGQNLPLIYRDSLLFTTNGSQQKVQLAAWGQDANYFLSDTLKANTVWTAEKPYVIARYLFVPQGKTLQIKEGVQLHLAPYSWLFVEGKLEILGNSNNRVVIQGDRLQPNYEETAGQFGGIWLSYPSTENRIEYATIKNGTVGVFIDSISSNNKENLRIKNCFIRNMSFDGIASKGGRVAMQNCLISNFGRIGFLGQLGGAYDLKHNTLANYTSSQGNALVFNNIERDDYGFPTGNTYDIDFSVQNCILSGYAKDELILDIDPQKQGTALVNHSLIKADELYDLFDQKDLNNQVSRLSFFPKFQDISNRDYRLDTLSPAIDAGRNLSPAIEKDYNDEPRNGMPDAGALEKM